MIFIKNFLHSNNNIAILLFDTGKNAFSAVHGAMFS